MQRTVSVNSTLTFVPTTLKQRREASDTAALFHKTVERDHPSAGPAAWNNVRCCAGSM